MPPYKSLLAPLLFTQDPEKIHHRIALVLERMQSPTGLKWLNRWFGPPSSPGLHQNIMGLNFSHPIGMAAGFDKDARMYKALSAMGFSFVEIGTLTPQPQLGNEKPRLFRLKQDQALINRMGFNNGGVDAALPRLRSKGHIIVGGNIGKNKFTPNEKAVDDYLLAFDHLYPFVDYFVLNVSSPNTPGLRELQDKQPLMALIRAVMHRNASKAISRPILLKIAPDLNDHQLREVAEVILESKLDGVIAGNTTINRDGLKTPESTINKIGAGGLSGLPLKHRSTLMVQQLRQYLGNEPVIIGVGGIFNGRDVIEKLIAGADLVQVYTGFVYEGPSMVKNCLQEMLHGLKSGHWNWSPKNP